MTIDRNDPRWTAYALDELSQEERVQFETEIAADPDAVEVLAELDASVGLIRDSLMAHEPVLLTDAQRERVFSAVPESIAIRSHRWGRWPLAAGIAASLVVGFVAFRVAQEVPDRSGSDTLVSYSSQAPGPAPAPARVTASPVQEGAGGGDTPPAPTPREIAGNVSPRMNELDEVREQPVSDRRADGNRQESASVAGDVAFVEEGHSTLDDLRSSDEAPGKLAAVPPPGPSGQAGGVLGGVLRSVAPAFEAETGAGPNIVLDAIRVSAFAAEATPPPAPAAPASAAFPDRRPAQFSTEEYDRIIDNAFRLVSQEPLATFSVDVDTASYANVRRFLNQRTLPPADAVRIEEMVNYFTYDYAPPRDGRPVRVHAEVAQTPWAAGHRLVRIGIQAQEISRDERAPSNLVFLIDVSGSMNEPDKLPLLVDGMKLLVDQLGENDRVAIAVYAGASGLVLDSTPGFRRERILSALERLRAGGSTNGGAGIQLAYDVAVRNFIDGGINRVILATDGDFNVGITNNGDLTRLIEEEARTGVFLSVLGFGTGNYNDAGLEALADRGNGNYAYIDSIREARKVLVEEIGSTLVTVARDVKFQVEFNPAEVGAYRLVGYENRALENQDFNDDTVDAGEIGAGHTVTALFEIVPAGVEIDVPGVDPLRYQTPLAETREARSGELLTVKVRYKEPDGDQSLLLETPVVDRDQGFDDASADFRFASAVAGFGMILRDSPYRGSATFDSVLRIAEGSRGADEGEYRSEFVELVRRARAISDLGR